MDLAVIWFVLVALIFAIYFFLDGFTFGQGILQPFLSKTESERSTLIGTVGPFWAANEVWIILGAGAIFAAFPLWYGTLFTALYPWFTLVLLAMIGRGVAFEYRSEFSQRKWLRFWDFTSFACHLIPAFLWGLILANMVHGLPIGERGRFEGTLLDTLNPFALLGGVALLCLFVLHGATFLLLRLPKDGVLHQRSRRAALIFGSLATVLVVLFVYVGFVRTGLFDSFGVSAWVFPVLAALNLVAIWATLTLRKELLSFLATGLTLVFLTATVFVSMYPNVLRSTLGPQFHLTVANSSSERYTLTFLTIASACFLPLIIAYQAWNFYVFRRRVAGKHTAYDDLVEKSPTGVQTTPGNNQAAAGRTAGGDDNATSGGTGAPSHLRTSRVKPGRTDIPPRTLPPRRDLAPAPVPWKPQVRRVTGPVEKASTEKITLFGSTGAATGAFLGALVGLLIGKKR